VSFDGPVDETTITPDTLQLLDEHGQPVPLTNRSTSSSGAFLGFDTLAEGNYRLLIKTSAIKDLAGNLLEQPDVTIHFARAPLALNTTAPIDPQTGHVRGGEGSSIDVQVFATDIISVPHSQLLINGQGHSRATRTSGTARRPLPS